MNNEFDYELTASQWETLKALRAPAANPSSISKFTVERLIAHGLVDYAPRVTHPDAGGPQGAEFVARHNCSRISPPDSSRATTCRAPSQLRNG